MKITTFGASSSKNSINKTFAHYTSKQFENATIEFLDLNDYSLPLFSVDLEVEMGIPQNAKDFYLKILNSDLLVISMAEHNGSYSAAFKNLLDWISRYEGKVFANKKMFLLSTSPGGRGGESVLEAALARFPRHAAEIVEHFSLPNFEANFDLEKGILDETLRKSYLSKIELVKNNMNQ
jgi:chromate reductase, NAD(P)H dehydrogenase (quinone)